MSEAVWLPMLPAWSTQVPVTNAAAESGPAYVTGVHEPSDPVTV
jgi:hypothetical protein